MWQISIQKKEKGNLVTLTKSLYPTKPQAQNAATQLRLISRGWKYGIQSIECNRPNAKIPTWRHHDYIVTPPVEERVN